MAKLIPAGFFQKRKSNTQPSNMTVNQKRLGLAFIKTSTRNFLKDSCIELAETLKRYHFFANMHFSTLQFGENGRQAIDIPIEI